MTQPRLPKIGTRGISILGVLLSIIVILLLYYFYTRLYFNVLVDRKTRDTLHSEGVDTSSFQAIIDSTKEKAKEIEEQLKNREGDMTHLLETGK
jgi:hypothetical protein